MELFVFSIFSQRNDEQTAAPLTFGRVTPGILTLCRITSSRCHIYGTQRNDTEKQLEECES